MATERGRAGARGTDETGLGLVEALVWASLALVLLLAVYQLLIASRRAYVGEVDRASARAAGRAALDLLSYELRVAGLSPLGLAFDAIPSGDAKRVRRLADLDGDALVSASEPDEDLTYVFSDPDLDGVYDLLRGVDSNGDGDFADPGESAETVARDIVPLPGALPGLNQPFLAYDLPPPLARRVSIRFGVRAARPDLFRTERVVLVFAADAALRNRS